MPPVKKVEAVDQRNCSFSKEAIVEEEFRRMELNDSRYANLNFLAQNMVRTGKMLGR